VCSLLRPHFFTVPQVGGGFPPKTIVSIQSEPSSSILNLKTLIPAAQNSHFSTRITSKKAKSAPQVLHKTFRPGARAIYGKVQVVAQKCGIATTDQFTQDLQG
jgi:hypothetical protein